MIAERLANDEQVLVDQAGTKVLRLLSDGIESIGGIDVACGVCGGTDRSDLRRAIDRTSTGGAARYVRVEHVIAIGARLRRYNASLVTKLGSALVECFDLEVFPRVSLKAEDKVERLERLVKSMPMGDQMLEHAYRSGR